MKKNWNREYHVSTTYGATCARGVELSSFQTNTWREEETPSLWVLPLHAKKHTLKMAYLWILIEQKLGENSVPTSLSLLYRSGLSKSSPDLATTWSWRPLVNPLVCTITYHILKAYPVHNFDPFFDLATSMPKIYRICPKSFVWNLFCIYNFNSLISWVSSPKSLYHPHKQAREFVFPDEVERKQNGTFEHDEVQTPKHLRQISQIMLPNHALRDDFNPYKDFLRR